MIVITADGVGSGCVGDLYEARIRLERGNGAKLNTPSLTICWLVESKRSDSSLQNKGTKQPDRANEMDRGSRSYPNRKGTSWSAVLQEKETKCKK